MNRMKAFNSLTVVRSLLALSFLVSGMVPTSPPAIAANDVPVQSTQSTGASQTTQLTQASQSVDSAFSTKVTTTSSGAEAWRKKPPVLPPPRPFSMTKVTSYKLENGLEVELVPDHRFPFTTASIGIKAGSCFEPKDKTGTADICADMLTEGTATKKSKQLADEVDFIGGGLKASSDFDFTLLSGSALAKYNDKLFDLMTDVLLHPSFPDDELTLKKANLVQELAMKRSEPEFLVEERFHKVLFGDHPYGVVAPTPTSVKAITRADLQSFHDRCYLPNESVLVVVGDFDEAKMKELINNKFGSDWKRGTLPIATMPAVPKQEGRHIFLVNRPGSVQSNLRLGNIAISKTNPNYFPMIVANEVLGGATQARLFLNIREQKGYTYGAYSGLSARRQPGSFTAEAEVRTEVTAPSLEEFLYELDRIRNVKVTEKELKDAKSYMVGSFQLGLETQSGLAQRLLESKLYDLPSDYLETYSSKVMAVTPEQIRTVARQMIDLQNIVISVVGDASKIKSDLEYFGPVQVYDTSGALSAGADKVKTDSGKSNSGS
jgi:zinc protease